MLLRHKLLTIAHELLIQNVRDNRFDLPANVEKCTQLSNERDNFASNAF